jgi:hypothetical protein
MIGNSSDIERDFRTLIHHWIHLLADYQIEEADRTLDRPTGDETFWTAQKTIDTIHEIYNPSTRYYRQHAGRLTITASPDEADSIRVSAYHDGSGYWVDYDLYLNDERSDIVIQFQFKRILSGYLALVRDVHVL